MIYRTEHPNPQFERENWENLNGAWDFGFQKGLDPAFAFSADESRAQAIREKGEYPYKINVPFCPQSALSGIGETDFIHLAWYRRKITVPQTENRIFLHIGAADYQTTVLVNGALAGRHRGGYTSFCFDITALVTAGENELFILCEDNCTDPLICRGKQSEKRESHGCDYTRTTGIWQTVWLEYVPAAHLSGLKIFPDVQNGAVTLFASFAGRADFSCEVLYEGKKVGAAAVQNAENNLFTGITLAEKHLWEPGAGRLYTLILKFGNDTVKSYFGLREARMDGFRFLLNGKSVFQRLVLDQGYYKEGLYTAPDEEAMERDIRISMDCGFNGARLHQKVFEPRFLYLCDRLGYLVWGEYANWGLDYSDPRALPEYLAVWGEAMERDFNHPSIIGWCPFNETWDYQGKRQFDGLLSAVYRFTKALDPTRPCIDTSGNYHVITDIFDVHDYEQDVALFRQNYARVAEGIVNDQVERRHGGRQQYAGEPLFISEYGGIKWESDRSVEAWGYGKDVTSQEEFLARYTGLTEAILENDRIMGFCYTQLYDIEQEQNGLFTYERKKKLEPFVYEGIRAVNTRPAAIEE